MAGLVRFIRVAGRIVPIRAPLHGAALQKAPAELAMRMNKLQKHARLFGLKAKALASDSEKLASLPGGTHLHVSAEVNKRVAHAAQRQQQAKSVVNSLTRYKTATSGAALVARNPVKSTLAVGAGVTAYEVHKSSSNPKFKRYRGYR